MASILVKPKCVQLALFIRPSPVVPAVLSSGVYRDVSSLLHEVMSVCPDMLVLQFHGRVSANTNQGKVGVHFLIVSWQVLTHTSEDISCHWPRYLLGVIHDRGRKISQSFTSR